MHGYHEAEKKSRARITELEEKPRMALTKEQRAAIQEAIFVLNGYDLPYYVAQMKVLEAMLASPPAWEATVERQEAIDGAADLLGWAISEATNAEKRDARSARVILWTMLEEVGK